MQIGMIGLERMGANMTRRLMRAGHACVVYARRPGSVERLVAEGASATLLPAPSAANAAPVPGAFDVPTGR